jgi:glucosylceramidase
VIGLDKSDADLQVTAAQNPDGSIAVVVFNEGIELKTFELSLGETSKLITIQPQAIQTIVVPK